MLQRLIADGCRINGPSWSLSAEWLTYLVAPWIVMLVFRIRRKGDLIAFASLVFFINIMFYYSAAGRPPFDLIKTVAQFTLGCCLYNFIVYHKMTYDKWDSVLLVVVLIYLALFHYNDIWSASLLSGLAIALIPLMVIALAGSKGMARRFFSCTAMLYLGEISYSIYMVHYPFLMFFQSVGGEAVVLGGDASYLKAISVIGLFFALLILLSAACFHLVENPVRTYVKKRLSLG